MNLGTPGHEVDAPYTHNYDIQYTLKIRVYLSLYLIKHQVWYSGGLAPCILNHGTRWRWVVSFASWSLSWKAPQVSNGQEAGCTLCWESNPRISDNRTPTYSFTIHLTSFITSWPLCMNVIKWCMNKPNLRSVRHLCNEKLRNLHSSTRIITMVRQWRIRLVWHVARMEELRNAYKTLVETSEGKI
jgi:hypothetical protein